MMSRRSELWWLGVILAIAAIPRLIGLTNDRLGYSNDEIIYAYDGWSIATTGTDHRQTGHPPLYLKGASDIWDNRTSILYPYLIALESKMIGWPTVFAVRLPAIIAGFGVVIFGWAVARQLFADRRIARWTGLFLALNPLAVLYGRNGHDVILLPLCVLATLWAILRTRQRPWSWAWAGLFLALGMYTYQPFKLVGPLAALLATCYVWPSLTRTWRQALIGAAVGLGLGAPFLVTQLGKWSIVQGEFSRLSILGRPDAWASLLHNVGAAFGPPYLWSVRLNLLFVPILALLSWLFFRSAHRRERILLTGLFIAGLLPVFLTEPTGSYLGINHARALGTLGMLDMLAAATLVALSDSVKKLRRANHLFEIRTASLALMVAATAVTWAWFIVSPPWMSPRTNAGLIDGIQFVTQPPYVHRPVSFYVYSTETSRFVLWRSKYTPATFLRGPVTWYETSSGLQLPISFGRWRFCQSCLFTQPNELIVAPAGNAPAGHILLTFTATEFQSPWVVVEPSSPPKI